MTFDESRVQSVLTKYLWTGEPERTNQIKAAVKTLTEMSGQQLVARIKKSSKWAYQAPKGGWFDVRVVPDMGYGLRGNNNNYRFGDVVFGVPLEDGTVVELK
jgi:hypothetical protein